MDEFAQDGTQALPPPRFFPDALSGPVADVGPLHREVVTPVEPARPVVVPPPAVPVPARRAPVRRPAPPASTPPASAPPVLAPHAPLGAEPKKGRGALIGCLVVLVATGGLLVNVLREIIGAVVDLLR